MVRHSLRRGQAPARSVEMLSTAPTQRRRIDCLGSARTVRVGRYNRRGVGAGRLGFRRAAGLGTLAQLGLRPHVITPSGGAHVYCQHPGGAVPTMNSKAHAALGAVRPGTDIRGDGGYACFVGRTDKGAYRIVRGFADLEPAEVVTRVLAAVQEAKAPTPSPGAGNVSGNGTFPEGERHGALVSFAGRCRRAGMDGSEILAALRQFNARTASRRNRKANYTGSQTILRGVRVRLPRGARLPVARPGATGRCVAAGRFLRRRPATGRVSGAGARRIRPDAGTA